MASTYAYPYPGAPRGRIDQGVDFAAPGQAHAIASGTVVRVSPPGSFVGGTGEAVYISMDVPWTAPSGTTYSEIYYAEQHPLVALGAPVAVGQAVMAAGGSEIGFARNTSPACALVGGLGAGSQPTTCGNDMYALLGQILAGAIGGLGAPPPPGVQGPTTATPPRPSRQTGLGVPGLEGPAGVALQAWQRAPFTASAWANFTHTLAHVLPHDLARVRKARYAMVRAVR